LAFTIAHENGKQIIKMVGKVRGTNITSFRTELSGVVAALQETTKFHPEVIYTLYCDNKAVVT
jgi:ribonuclease HI